MGASWSMAEESGSAGPTGMADLPEGCLAEVLARLEPAEICRLARLSRAFRAAAAADFIWEAKLPRGYRRFLGRVLPHPGAEDGRNRNPKKGSGSGSKKELYSRLCRPTLFDGGTKEFWLEKHSGGICISISSKALSITMIDDRRYWNYVPTEESRFHTVAYLQQIWWLEVDGELDFYFPEGTYSLYFRLHLGRASRRLGRRINSPQHIHGWDIQPVRFQLSTSDGQRAQSKCYLDDPGTWIHYHVGDFDVQDSEVSTKVKFSMIQIDCTHTKGGLCVDSVLVCPKGFQLEKEMPPLCA
ncbi:F-box protein PP2-A13-like [Iris pallida]|uniref:F-box protein PP2-A13-like n=1 Tax=Iris pallida TaxID=29817 RepID=A0AAX6IE22_IRIPA|nr:F-box protein PP2-A13-like [Iris pallida]